MNPGDLFADVNYESVFDCHSFVAMDLAVTVDNAVSATSPEIRWMQHARQPNLAQPR